VASEAAYGSDGPDLDKLAEKALRCFKQASEAWAKQRERERDDLRFQVPEMQWDEAARRSRLGISVEGVPTPARPLMSIPKIDQPIDLVLTAQRAAHLGVDIHPISEDAEDDTAEVLQDLYRQIERDSNANLVRSWAYERAVMCGLGAYRVRTVYDDQGGSPLDQKIMFERILDQSSVYLDPAAQKADFSDGRWAFVASWMDREVFEDEFGEEAATLMLQDPLMFEEAAKLTPEWVLGDKEHQALLVAEYYWKVPTSETYCLCDDGRVYEEEDVPTRLKVKRTVKRSVDTVWWAKIGPGGQYSGIQFLEGPQETNGHLIPIVVTVGRELQPFDAERRWRGMIGPAKDAQRGYNYAASQALELSALEPKAPWIAEYSQIEDWEDEWQQSNVRNIPVLRYNAKSVDGRPLPPPQRAPVDTGRLTSSLQLLSLMDSALQASTAAYNPLLGQVEKEQSGKAILALQNQGDQATSSYLQNFQEIAINSEAHITLDLMPAIYDRPGRVVRTLSLEGESNVVMLNASHYSHPETGFPVRLPDMTGPQQILPRGVKVKRFDLSKGRYGVAISIGRAYQTRLAHGSDAVGQLIQKLPPELQIVALPTWMHFQDWPGARELSELIGKVRDQQFPYLTQGEDGATDPKQLMAQLQALQGQLQQATQALQQAQQAVETKQAEQQAKIQVAQLQAQLQMKLKEMDNAAKIEVARIQAARATYDTDRAAHEEEIALAMDQVMGDRKMAHDVAMKILDHRHERAMARMEALTEGEQAAHDRAHESALAAQEHIHGLASASHAASLTPLPTEDGQEPPTPGAEPETGQTQE